VKLSCSASDSSDSNSDSSDDEFSNAMLRNELAEKDEVIATLAQLVRQESCIPAGQCYYGSDAKNECCAGTVVDATLKCTKVDTCSACKKAVGEVVSQLASKGCAYIIPEGAVVCEAAGLGPEDPMADLCAIIVVASCSTIANYVANGIQNPEQICEDINWCTASGEDLIGGHWFGVECGCVESTHCTYHEEGCCSGKSAYSWHCVPPLSRCT